MKHKRLYLLIAGVFISFSANHAQTRIDPIAGFQNHVPFGKKLPPPAIAPNDIKRSSSNSMNEIAAMKKTPAQPYIEFDTISRKVRFLSPGSEYAQPTFAPFSYTRSGIDSKKDKSFIKSFDITKDINVISSSYPYNYNQNNHPSAFAIMNGVSYFAADDGINGRELWRSDGTAKGTHLYKDLNPGEASSNPSEITVVNNKLVFSAFSAAYGLELWVSDGTDAGSKMLMDATPGPQSSRPVQIVPVGNDVFFLNIPDYTYRPQLWKVNSIDGTGGLLLDAGELSVDAYIYQLREANGLLYFSAGSYMSGMALWRSDGTRQGTFALKNFGFNFFGIKQLTAYKDKVFFSSEDGTGRRLWVTDGTVEGTSLAPGHNNVFLADDYYSSAHLPFTQLNNNYYMVGYTEGYATGLYKYDPAGTSGVQLVKDFPRPPNGYVAIQGDLLLTDGIIYFRIVSSIGGHHDEIWRSDGTSANTTLVKQISSQGYFNQFHPHNGKLFFTRYEQASGYELWVSDGTSDGTGLIKDILEGPDASYPTAFTSINGNLIFNATNEDGSELWISDGTAAGTTVLKNINRHSTHGSYPGSYRGDITTLGSDVIFFADDGEHGREVYRSNGTRGGTIMLKDLNPDVRRSYYPTSLKSKNGFAYFLTNRYEANSFIQSIYKTDGTGAGTTKFIDIAGTSIVTYEVSENGLIYYVSYNSSEGIYEMWRTDGSQPGTFMLAKHIFPSSGMALASGKLYFVAGDAQYGYEVWKSDGSKEGTMMIKDIFNGSNGSYPYSFFPYNNEVYFGAWDGMENYYSFWKSDGSTTGTLKLKALAPSGMYYQGPIFAVSNNILFFSGYDYNAYAYQGNQLWKTDGTAAGTRLVKQINPAGSAEPFNFIDVSGRLFFLANDGEHEHELWTSDGTEAGTRMVKDINPPGYYSNMRAFSSGGGKLFFLKYPNELWSSDGTPENTARVSDDVLDQLTSMDNLVIANQNIYVSAGSYKYGTELFTATIKQKSKALTNIELKAIPELSNTAFKANVFPNPARSFSTLVISGNVQDVGVKLTDIAGRMFWQKRFSNTTLINLPVDKMTSGLYTVTVDNRTEVKTIKLIRK